MTRPQLLTIGFIALLSGNVFAQIPKEPINIQAPNAASFTQIGDYKTSFTGNIPIIIPLCNISDGSLDVPISVNNNTSGVRPEVHPGWIGINMDLNVGGAIVRTVRDSPDDNNKTMTNGSPVPSLVPGFLFAGNLLNTADWNTYNKVADFAFNNFDSEPDEFNFNANGLSGKFFFGQDGKVKIQSEQNLKVELIGSQNTTYPPFVPPSFTGNKWYDTNNQKYMNHWDGFRVIDEKGTTYVFGGGDNNYMEYSMNFFDQGKDTWICNAWYLKSVTTHTGQAINYTYERGDFIAQMALGISNIENITVGNQWFNEKCEDKTIGLSQQGVYNGKLISPVYLKEINTKNTQIKFISSESTELKYEENIFSKRWDYEILKGKAYVDISAFLMDCYIPGQPFSTSCNFISRADLLSKLKWRKLDKIQVINTYDGITSKEFEFIYDNTANQRLRLQKIQETGTNNTDKINPYEFFYITYPGKTLPNYGKSHTDHWGFNNGKIINLSNDFNDYANYGTNYRGPATGADTLNYYLSTLEKIKFPTGGVTEFTYEQHTYSKVVKLMRSSGFDDYGATLKAGGLRIKKTKTYDPNTTSPAIEKYFYYGSDFNPKQPNNGCR